MFFACLLTSILSTSWWSSSSLEVIMLIEIDVVNAKKIVRAKSALNWDVLRIVISLSFSRSSKKCSSFLHCIILNCLRAHDINESKLISPLSSFSSSLDQATARSHENTKRTSNNSETTINSAFTTIRTGCWG